MTLFSRGSQRAPLRLPFPGSALPTLLIWSLTAILAGEAFARQHEHHEQAAPPKAASADPSPGLRIDSARAVKAWPDTTGGEPLSLEEVLAWLDERNPELEAARIDARTAATGPARVSSLPDPMVSGEFMAGRGRMARSEWMVEQAFPWPGTLDLRRRAAEASARGAEVGAVLERYDLVLEATNTYLEIAALQEKLIHLAHFREELIGFERAAASRYETGNGPQQAILRLQLEKNSTAEKDLMLRIELADRFERLRRLAGDPEDLTARSLVLPAAPAPSPATGDGDRTADEALLDQEAERLNLEVRLAELSFRPELSARITWVEGSIMRENRSAIGIGGAISLPLRKDARRASLEAARLERTRLDAEREALLVRLDTERAAARSRLAAGRALLDLIDQTLIPQAEATRQATVSAYAVGRADYLDLLDAERMLVELRLSRIDRLVDVHRDTELLRRLTRTASVN